MAENKSSFVSIRCLLSSMKSFSRSSGEFTSFTSSAAFCLLSADADLLDVFSDFFALSVLCSTSSSVLLSSSTDAFSLANFFSVACFLLSAEDDLLLVFSDFLAGSVSNEISWS